MGQTRRAITPYKALNSQKDKILNNIFFGWINCILSLKPNFWNERDAIFTDQTEIKTFIILLCFAGTLRSNNKSLQELKVLVKTTFRNYASSSYSDSHTIR